MDFLEQQLMDQLAGGRSRTDVEFVAGLGIDYETLEVTLTDLVDQQLVEVISPEGASETEYKLASGSLAQAQAD